MIVDLVWAGLVALEEYVALHVLTCLIPAFLLAGAMVTFVSKEAIVRYIGAATSKLVSFPVAAGGSFFVAACSCTVIPVSSGLYYGGAGIGPAFILLWVAPAANLLALVYTGAILGSKMVITRLLVSLVVAFIIGWVMSVAFLRQEQERLGLEAVTAHPSTAALPEKRPRLAGAADLVLLGLLVVTLLAPNYLIQQGPYAHKVAVWAATTVLAMAFALWAKPLGEIKRWLQECWWFVRMIFPLLLVGVFAVGVISALLPEAWIQKWLGSSSLLSAFLATLIGGLSYFATMTEAPFVDRMMDLGMAPGPALALLLTGPGISLPNWLAVARVFGVKKALVYVSAVIVLGSLFGWAAGELVF